MEHNGLTVEFDHDPVGRGCFVIYVRSKNRHNLEGRAIVYPQGDLAGIKQRVSMSAGACAEHVCEKYGDNLGCEAIAAAAIRLFEQECVFLEQNKAVAKALIAEAKRIINDRTAQEKTILMAMEGRLDSIYSRKDTERLKRIISGGVM